MAVFRYFADVDGFAVELFDVQHDGHISSKAHHFSGTRKGGGPRLVATRLVQRKANPSNHVCNAKCQSARGHICECVCGGANHGRFSMVCEAIEDVGLFAMRGAA